MKNQFLSLSACLCILPAGCVQLSKATNRSESTEIANTREVSEPGVVQQTSPTLIRNDAVTTVAFSQRDDDEMSAGYLAGEPFDSLNADQDETESLELSLKPVNIPPFDTMEVIDSTSYTLADVEHLALSNNPTIAAAAATSNKAVGLRQQVGTRPNPTLGYFGFQVADRGTDQHGAFVQQEFVRGDKLALNQAVLQQTTNAQRWEIETQRFRVLTDVRVRFFEALVSQRQLDAINDFAEVAAKGVQVASDREGAKEGTSIDVLQSQTLLSEVTLAAERAEVAYRGAWQDLAAIAGLPVTTPIRLTAEFDSPEDSPNWDEAYLEIVSQSPEMAVARALVCEKQAMLKRQQVQMVPNVTGQLGVGYDDATNSGMINLQVGAPIQVWNKNSGNVSAAFADYTRAVQNVKRIEQSIKARLARAAQEYDASLASVRKYQSQILPQTEKSLELSEQAYRVGELSFLQILVVRRSYYDSRIQMIAVQGQLAQAGAKVDGLLLTGGLEAPADFTNGDGIRGQALSGL